MLSQKLVLISASFEQEADGVGGSSAFWIIAALGVTPFSRHCGRNPTVCGRHCRRLKNNKNRGRQKHLN